MHKCKDVCMITGHLRIPRYLAHIATCKTFLIQVLCEDICQLLFSVDVNDINIFLHDMVSEKVMMNLNTLLLDLAALSFYG